MDSVSVGLIPRISEKIFRIFSPLAEEFECEVSSGELESPLIDSSSQFIRILDRIQYVSMFLWLLARWTDLHISLFYGKFDFCAQFK